MPPHLLGPLPPQTLGAVQGVPHCKLPPQPSPMGPQVAPTLGQVCGVQVPPSYRLCGNSGRIVFGRRPVPRALLLRTSRRRVLPNLAEAEGLDQPQQSANFILSLFASPRTSLVRL